jgi:hypothetical protein
MSTFVPSTTVISSTWLNGVDMFVNGVGGGPGNSASVFNVADATTAHHAVAFDQAFGLGQTNTWVTYVDGTTYTNASSKAQVIEAEFLCTSTGNVTITYKGSTLSGSAFSNTTGVAFYITIPMAPGDTLSYHVSSGAYTVTGITFA